jgi:hypothetical protein
MKGFKMVDERQEKEWEVEIKREYRGHEIKWRILVDDLSIVRSHIDGTIGLFGEVSTTKPQAQTQRPTATQEQGSFKSTYGVTLYCPEHTEVELRETIPQYQEYDVEIIDGVETKVPAKFYCPKDLNGTEKNHSVWRSKALTDREIVV